MIIMTNVANIMTVGAFFNGYQVATIALVTALIRFIPFLLFKDRQTPKLISYLGTVLPMAIMGMLVVFCLKSISFGIFADWVPAFIAIIAVIVLHTWRRNTLLSILGGTIIYMVLINLVF